MSEGFFKFGRPKPVPGLKIAPGLAELDVEGAGVFSVTQVATVGRAPECQVPLNFRSVSRNHARVFYEGGHFWVKDLDSANGTCVNGKKIRLQMLTDGDKVTFGDVKAVFHSGSRARGPAPLAEDPLAGTDQPIPDGTPTGGLGDVAPREQPAPGVYAGGMTMEVSGPEFSAQDNQMQALTQKVESLQAENERLRRGINQMRTTFRGTGVPDLQKPETGESDRLRRLVTQLERALADSNLRVRNLQERLDQKR